MTTFSFPDLYKTTDNSLYYFLSQQDSLIRTMCKTIQTLEKQVETLKSSLEELNKE